MSDSVVSDPTRAAGSMTRPAPGAPVLVRLPNWIGDAVMAAPAVEEVIVGLAPRRVELLGIASVLELFAGFQHPNLERLPPLPAGGSRPDHLFERGLLLRKRRYGGVLILPPSFSSAALGLLAGAPLRVGWPTDGRRALLTGRTEAPGRDTHLRRQYRKLAETFLSRLAGGHSRGTGAVRNITDTASPEALWMRSRTPRLPLWGDELSAARAWWETLALEPHRTVGMAPGAIYGATKRWRPERYVALAARRMERGWNVVWLGGPAEVELAHALDREVRAAAGPPSPGTALGRSQVAAGKLSLRESLAVMASMAAVVSNDSGAMHLADAAGAPVVGIFGSTSPDWTGPVGEHARVARHYVPCSPCFSRTCPTQIECLHDLSVDDVDAALQSALAASHGPTSLRRPAVFLDRDGTLIEPVPYLRDPGHIRLVPGAAQALRELRRAGFLAIVVTNQSAIARGLLDADGLQRIHLRLEELLEAQGSGLDGFEWCPHHPEFDTECACRKPGTAMIDRAVHRWNIDRARSVVIGDAEVDAEVAANAGMPFILVRTGYGRATEQKREVGDPAPTETQGVREPGERSRFSVSDDVASAIEGLLRDAPSQR